MMSPRPVSTTMTRMTPKRPDTAPATRRLLHEDLTREIISAFYEVYNTLGYGFLESDRNQLLNYLRSSCLEVGLLLHFGPRPRFKRVVAENARNVRLPNQVVSASSASS